MVKKSLLLLFGILFVIINVWAESIEISGGGSGDMSKSVYDTGNNSKVDSVDQISTLTNTKWCSSNGTVITCTETSPVLTEVDAVVKALSGIIKSNGSTISAITDNSANWDTAYTDRLKWDGGATGLVAATGRTSLGLVIGTDIQAYNVNTSILGSTIGATELASEDFGSFTCNGTTCTVDNDAITLTTQTSGNYVTSVATTSPLSGGAAASEGATLTLSLTQLKDIVTTSPLSGGENDVLSGADADLTLSIADAIADNSTKGASTYAAADFDTSSGIVSLDYVNGQAASTSLKGFLNSTDWNTFNGKQSALTNSAGLAGALDNETGTGLAVFATSPTLTTPNIGVATATSVNGMIPVAPGTNPTIDSLGKFTVDTTADQFLYATSSGNTAVLTAIKDPCFTILSPVDTDDNIPIASPVAGITIVSQFCRIQGGNAVVMRISDGTNDMEWITCDSDGQADDGSLINNTFIADERVEYDTSVVSGTVTAVNWCNRYTIDRQ